MRAAASSPISTIRLGRGAFSLAGQSILHAILLPLILQLNALRIPLRKLAVAAVAAGLLLAPLPSAFSHDALDDSAYAASDHRDVADHDHSHDDDDTDDQAKKHGHDPVDHSHQIAFLAGTAIAAVTPLPKGWPSVAHGRPDQAAGVGIERPPKGAMSL